MLFKFNYSIKSNLFFILLFILLFNSNNVFSYEAEHLIKLDFSLGYPSFFDATDHGLFSSTTFSGGYNYGITNDIFLGGSISYAMEHPGQINHSAYINNTIVDGNLKFKSEMQNILIDLKYLLIGGYKLHTFINAHGGLYYIRIYDNSFYNNSNELVTNIDGESGLYPGLKIGFSLEYLLLDIILLGCGIDYNKIFSDTYNNRLEFSLKLSYPFY